MKTVYVGSDGKTTVSDLAPGTYKVCQVLPPVGTNDATTDPVEVEVVSKGTATAEFVNPVPGIGIIRLQKFKDDEPPRSAARRSPLMTATAISMRIKPSTPTAD